MADRGVSGPWGPQFCGALCKGVTQRFPAGVWVRPFTLGGIPAVIARNGTLYRRYVAFTLGGRRGENKNR